MSITLDAVSRRFGTCVAVNQVSITVNAGDLLVLVGPSGCGKSTLLNAIAGQVIVDSGAVYLQGERVADRQTPLSAEHQSAVHDHFSGTLRLLDAGPLSRNAAGPQPGAQSLGEQQLRAFRELISDLPDIVLLDDPLSGVDPISKRQALAEFQEARQKVSMTALWATHDFQSMASLADQIAVMQAGALIQVASAEALYHRPLNEAVARYMGAGSYLVAHGLGPASSLREGRCRVISPDFEAEVNCTRESQAGDVMILIRPDDVVLTTHEAMSNCARGVVRSCTFTGERFDVVVELLSGNVLMLREEKHLDIGQPIVVQVCDGWVLPA